MRPPAPGAVEVWTIDLDAEASPAVLAPDEVARSRAFRFDRDRDRYVAGRAAVRRILGDYLGCDAPAVAFRYNEQGKPRLATSGSAPVDFNFTNCGGIGLLAVIGGGNGPVGIDLELVRAGFAGDEIAERFFAPEEVAVLRALPPADQELAFFRCWTRKEAFLKALGGGLSIPLDGFEVAFVDRAGAIVRLDPAYTPVPAAGWAVLDVSDVASGAVAAVAAVAAVVAPAPLAVARHRADTGF